MAVIDQTPEAVHRELKITVPTKETIEQELTAAELLTQEGIDAVKELNDMGDMHPKLLSASFRSALRKLDQEQRKMGLLVQQKAKEIDECLGQMRYMKLTRGILVSEMRDLAARYKEVHKEEQSYQEEQQELIQESKSAPRSRGRRKST